MSSTGRNYVKFDFNNIKLADTWDLRIQHLKDLLVEYIQKNNHSIYSKQYHESILNFYAVTSKLTTLNEIYILLIFVYPYDDFEKYNDILSDISKYLNANTKFSKISLWYQLTKSKMKPSENEKISYISGPIDICESIMDYRIYISPNSFTQSNYDAMIQLYQIIHKITNENKTDVLHYYGRGMTPISHVLKDNFNDIPLKESIFLIISTIICCFGLITMFSNNNAPVFISSALLLKPLATDTPNNKGVVTL